MQSVMTIDLLVHHDDLRVRHVRELVSHLPVGPLIILVDFVFFDDLVAIHGLSSKLIIVLMMMMMMMT